jgi:hypothetical protein
MDIDMIENGLECLQNKGIKTLDIYWLEDNEEGDPYWWVDIINDDLCELCKMHWIWTVMSQSEFENECSGMFTGEGEDWFITVEEGGFSDDLVHDVVRTWLRKQGFKFDVQVIDSFGTKGEKRIIEMIDEMKHGDLND